jgi:hypothetical protein
LLLALAIAAAAAAPNRAPLIFESGDILRALGEIDAVPGSWVEYLVKRKGTAAARVRFAVLDEPAPEGRYWLELDTALASAAPQAVRMLLHGDPSRARSIERMELYLLGQAPVAIPVGEIRDELEKDGPKKPARVIRRGKARVSVRGGAYDAEVFDVGQARVWKSAQVPLWGLVQARAQGETVELLRSGRTGARSLFPERFAHPRADHGKGSETTK